MAQRTKGTQISFRIEDEAARAIQEAADLEDLTLADFVRRVFQYGFFRYQQTEGGIFPLLQELRAQRLQESDGKHNRRKTDKK
jgi:hypothetical protein